MTTDELIKENNRLRKQLTAENKKYYEELLISIRLNGQKQEHTVEKTLLRILQDMIDAQTNGHSAQEFFDKTPNELSDDILAGLPRNSKMNNIKSISFVFILLLQFNLFNILLEPVVALSLFKTALPLGLILAVILLLLLSLKRSSFSKKTSYLFAFFAFICWLATLLIPVIDTAVGGIGKTFILSHQTFALILLVLSGIILLNSYLKKHSLVETLPTIILAVLEIMVLSGLVNPAFLSDGSRLLFSTMVLLIVVGLPALQLYKSE
jgi:hypothetical protein